MLVRILFARGPLVHKGRPKNVGNVHAAATLLTPISIACVLMGVWKVGSDMEWAEPFAIESGIFSHFQVWFALGAGAQAAAWKLARFGRRNPDTVTSEQIPESVAESEKKRAAVAN